MAHPGVNPGREPVVLNILIHPGPSPDQPRINPDHPGPPRTEPDEPRMSPGSTLITPDHIRDLESGKFDLGLRFDIECKLGLPRK